MPARAALKGRTSRGDSGRCSCKGASFGEDQNTMTIRKTDCEGFYRRDFLKIGAAGLFGLSLADILRLESQAAEKKGGLKKKPKGVSMLWLGGGPATIDMWDLKPDAPEGIRGSFKPIATKAD